MTPLRQRLIHDLQLRNYSVKTVDCYVRCVRNVAQHFGRSPAHLDAEHVRLYQRHLLGQRCSWCRFNQTVCALRFLYKVTLDKPDLVRMIPFGKKTRALPAVLSRDEVRRLFAAAASIPWLLMLVQTTYACGLRLGEVLRLKVTDIDSARMVLHVRCAKGRKDRLVPLSEALLALLRDYWQRYRVRDWLFPGRHHGKPLNIGSVQRLFRRLVLAGAAAGRGWVAGQGGQLVRQRGFQGRVGGPPRGRRQGRGALRRVPSEGGPAGQSRPAGCREGSCRCAGPRRLVGQSSEAGACRGRAVRGRIPVEWRQR
jgi:integrase